MISKFPRNPINQEKHTTLGFYFLHNHRPITLLPKDSHSLAGHSCLPLRGSPELMPLNWPLFTVTPLVYWLFPSTPLSVSGKTLPFSAMYPRLRPCSHAASSTKPKQLWSLPALFHFPCPTVHLSFSLASSLAHFL